MYFNTKQSKMDLKPWGYPCKYPHSIMQNEGDQLWKIKKRKKEILVLDTLLIQRQAFGLQFSCFLLCGNFLLHLILLSIEKKLGFLKN